ncbi:MAG: hypothetical protein ACRDUV_12650 [Pseudonocardiaceae bacterium]
MIASGAPSGRAAMAFDRAEDLFQVAQQRHQGLDGAEQRGDQVGDLGGPLGDQADGLLGHHRRRESGGGGQLGYLQPGEQASKVLR